MPRTMFLFKQCIYGGGAGNRTRVLTAVVNASTLQVLFNYIKGFLSTEIFYIHVVFL